MQHKILTGIQMNLCSSFISKKTTAFRVHTNHPYFNKPVYPESGKNLFRISFNRNGQIRNFLFIVTTLILPEVVL